MQTLFLHGQLEMCGLGFIQGELVVSIVETIHTNREVAGIKGEEVCDQGGVNQTG